MLCRVVQRGLRGCSIILRASGLTGVLVAEFISPKKYKLSVLFIVGSIIPKSVKCIHSATKEF